MAHTQVWFIGGKLVATGECGPERVHDQFHAPYSLAYFCPTCGEVWARRCITPATQWFVYTIPCEKCNQRLPYQLFLPGSVYPDYSDESFLNNLPFAVLKHEAELRLSYGDLPL